MGTAYHWEARRRQMALDQRRWKEKQKQQKELKKFQEQHQAEKKDQPSLESQQAPWQPQVLSQPPPEEPQLPPPKAGTQGQASPLLPQPGPSQPQSLPQPRQQGARDPKEPGPQLGSVGTHQTGKQPKDKFQGGQKISPDPGLRKAHHLYPDKHTGHPHFTSTNYVQQW